MTAHLSAYGRLTACGHYVSTVGAIAHLVGKEDDPRRVTCGLCRRTTSYSVAVVRWDRARRPLGLTDEDAETAIGLAVGAASVCWSDVTGAGVFDSDRAAAITDELVGHLRRLRLLPDGVADTTPHP